MNKVEILTELLDSANQINYNNKSNFDAIEKKLLMLTKKFFGESSSYIKDINDISYLPFAVTSHGYNDYVTPFESGLKHFKNIINTMIEDIKLDEEYNLNSTNKHELKNNDKVFIVHGHDEEIQIKVARFVEKLGFDAIILNEQTSSSRTIIEKIEYYSDVGFGIIIYTPCDIGSKNIEPFNLLPRARQNVVFEHGYLMGKIGRNNVAVLLKEPTEKLSDIDGVVYIKIDEDNSWIYKLADEMKASGYSIDKNRL